MVVWGKKMTLKGVVLLGDVALLAYLWPYRRECVTVGVGFEVFFAQAMFSVIHSSLAVAFRSKYRTHICLNTTIFCHGDNGLNR